MRLTIGMAVYDDFDGVYFTVQALRMYHPEVMLDTEIIVVDNNPLTGTMQERQQMAASLPHSRELQKFVPHPYSQTMEASKHTKRPPSLGAFQYIPYTKVKGTAAPRNKVFEAATGDFVLVIDPHVFIEPRALSTLLAWLEMNPKSNDLISGPIVYDGLNSSSTHFDHVWRGGMLGIWSSAWRCPCNATLYSARDVNGRLEFYTMSKNWAKVLYCVSCGRPMPDVPWAGHEPVLESRGMFNAGSNTLGKSFEIPAQGLGLFGCRKEAWLGFNDKFRGFGGEECYIHEKFRQAGRTNLCLPFLRWVHRFGRTTAVPGSAPYNPQTLDKVRNYIIGHSELGWPLEPLRNHFLSLQPPVMHPSHWDKLMENPLDPPIFWAPGHAHTITAQADTSRPITAPSIPPRESKPVSNWKAPKNNLEEWFNWLKTVGHDFRDHEDTLARLASECQHVTELGGRRGSSSLCLLAGRPNILRIVDPEDGYETNELVRLGAPSVLSIDKNLSLTCDLRNTDLLLIDTKHNGEQLTQELNRWHPHVSRYIVLHDTVLHGEAGEGGKVGLIPAIRTFLQSNPDWFIVTHETVRYGLTVLCKIQELRPEIPIIIWDPGFGPGTELKNILSQIGINPSSTCDCRAKALQMDQWGVKGCKAHRETIINWLREGHVKWGWSSRLTTAFRAVTTGLAFKLNPLDPFPGLVDLSIANAEARTQ